MVITDNTGRCGRSSRAYNFCYYDFASTSLLILVNGILKISSGAELALGQKGPEGPQVSSLRNSVILLLQPRMSVRRIGKLFFFCFNMKIIVSTLGDLA